MQKTILIVTDNTHDQINGVVTTFDNLIKMAESNDYVVKLIDPSLFKHFDCPGYPEVKLSIPINLPRLIESINPTYIHIATEGPVGIAAKLYCQYKGYRYNTSYHTKYPEFLNRLYGIPEWITYAYVRWFHRGSATILTTTKTMVKELQDNGFTGHIIPWTRGVDRTTFKRTLRDRPFNSGTILVNVGRVSKEKGIDDFCQLNIPNSSKLVIGDGPYLNELKEKYPDVHFIGPRRGEELAEFFANADVFVFPSKTDTFGIVIIEALSVGTPVAAYPVPGPIDIIDEGLTGSMTDNLEQAVLNCLSIDRQVVFQHSVKWTWQECWNIFRDALTEK